MKTKYDNLMTMKRSRLVEILAKEKYRDYLETVVSDIETLLYQCDQEFIHNTTEKVPQDIQFDVIPVMRKLKEVKKEAKTSLNLLKN